MMSSKPVLILLVALLLISTGFAACTPLSGWSYCKPIEINVSTSLTDNSTFFIVDTQSLISAGKLNTSCQDARFTNSSGDGNLSYWIRKGCNTTTTEFGVKFNATTANGTQMIFHYGNPSATDEQNGTKVFMAFVNQSSDVDGVKVINMSSALITDGTTSRKFTSGSPASNAISGYAVNINLSKGITEIQLYNADQGAVYLVTGYVRSASDSASNTAYLPIQSVLGNGYGIAYCNGDTTCGSWGAPTTNAVLERIIVELWNSTYANTSIINDSDGTVRKTWQDATLNNPSYYPAFGGLNLNDWRNFTYFLVRDLMPSSFAYDLGDESGFDNSSWNSSRCMNITNLNVSSTYYFNITLWNDTAYPEMRFTTNASGTETQCGGWWKVQNNTVSGDWQLNCSLATGLNEICAYYDNNTVVSNLANITKGCYLGDDFDDASFDTTNRWELASGDAPSESGSILTLDTLTEIRGQDQYNKTNLMMKTQAKYQTPSGAYSDFGFSDTDLAGNTDTATLAFDTGGGNSLRRYVIGAGPTTTAVTQASGVWELYTFKLINASNFTVWNGTAQLGSVSANIPTGGFYRSYFWSYTNDNYLDWVCQYDVMDVNGYNMTFSGWSGGGGITPVINFVSPTPLNGVNNFTYGIALNFTSDIALTGDGYIEIDGINNTCVRGPDNLSCNYTLTNAQHIFNNSYDIKPWANISGTYYTNTTLYNFSYYGCGMLISNGTLISDITHQDLFVTPQDGCIQINTSNVNFDGAGYSISHTGGGNSYGITLESVSNISVKNAVVYDMTTGGIMTTLSSYFNISNNTIYDVPGGLGIYTFSSDYGNISNNTLTANIDTGLALSSSDHYLIYDNIIQLDVGSTYELDVFGSTNHTIYNNIFNTTKPAHIYGGSSNIYLNTTKTLATNIIGGANIGGNFWSNYTGIDTDGDGIGDVTYTTGGVTDYLPLTNNGTALNFVSPTPLNGVNNFTYGMLFNFSSTLPVGENSYIQVDGVNHTCSLDLVTNTSCAYTLGTYSEHIFNNSYDLVIWANISNTYYTNATSYNFSYYGCGEVISDGVMQGNATMGLVPAGLMCMNLTADDIDLDCNYFTINATDAFAVGIYTYSTGNHTISNCEIYGGGDGITLAAVYGYNDVTNVNITALNDGIFVGGDYYSTNLSLYDVRIEGTGDDGLDITGMGYMYSDWLYVNGSTFDAVDIYDSVLIQMYQTQLNNSNQYGILLDGNSHADIDTISIGISGDDGINTDTPLNITACNVTDSGDDGIYSYGPVNLSTCIIDDTVEYSLVMDNSVGSTNLMAFNLTASNAGASCVLIEPTYNVSMANSTIYNCTSSGLIYDGDGNIVLENTRLFNTSSNAITLSGFPGPTFANFTNVTFDRPQGDWTTYTSIDMLDWLDMDGYNMNWSQNSTPAPTGFTVFAGKLINISSTGPTPSVIDWISFTWDDAEVGGSTESDFKLFKYNMTANWTLLNATPDTVGNTLNFNNMVAASDFGILEGSYSAWWISPTPPNGTNNFTYGMIYNYSTNTPMDVDDSYVEIDGVNYTCTVNPGDLQSCWYVLTYDEHIYNHTYSVRGFPHIGGHTSYIETNETRVVPYFGCGNISASDVLIGDVETYSQTDPYCFTYQLSHTDFGCQGYQVTSWYGSTFNMGDKQNLSFHDCQLADNGTLVNNNYNITASGDNITLRNNTFLNFSIISIETSNNTVIEDTTASVAYQIFLFGNNHNVSIDNVSNVFVDYRQTVDHGGNVTITNSDINYGIWSMGQGSFMNLTLINTSMANFDFAAYVDDSAVTLDAQNVTFRHSPIGFDMFSTSTGAYPSYHKVIDDAHMYNLSGFYYNVTGIWGSTSIFEFQNLIIDPSGSLTNFTNLSQTLYLGDFMLPGSCSMNISEGTLPPSGYSAIGQMLNFTCSGVESTEFNWSWTDAQIAGHDDQLFVLAHYDGAVWSVENATPDTTNNYMYLGYADPWQAGVYALLEGNAYVIPNITRPLNTTYAANPVVINMTCYGPYASYLANISVDGVVNVSSIPVANNTFYNQSNNFANGGHNITLTCWNGTTTNTSAPVYFTVAVPGTTLTIQSPANTTYNATTIDLNFTAADADGISACWFSINATANQSIPGCLNTSIAGYAEGGNNLTVYINDTLGNENSSIVYFTVDTIWPTIAIVSPTNTTYATSTVLINISANDTNLDDIWYFNGTANVSYTVPANADFADGGHTIVAYVNDSAGHVNSTNVTFTVDSTAPVITRINPPINSWGTTNTAVNFSFSATDLNAISCYLIVNGSLVYTNLTMASGIADNHSIADFAWGTHNWSVHCNDSVGHNISTTTWTFIIGDANPPNISYVTYTDTHGTTKYTATTSWIADNITANDSVSGIATIQTSLYRAGILVDVQTGVASPLTVNWTGLLPGVYTFNSSATDNAGLQSNLSSRTVTIVHASVPHVSILTPVGTSSDYTVTASCTGAFATYNCNLFMDGTLEDTQVCADSAVCTFGYAAPHDCNATTAIVSCTDGAGQQSNDTRIFTQVPDYTNVAPANGLTITNTTEMNFTMNWSCTPNNVSLMLTNPNSANAMNCSVNWNCSFIDNNWTNGLHMWSFQTGLTSGGYVSSPTYNFMVPAPAWNITTNISFAHNYTFTEFTTYVDEFYTDYAIYFLGILAYALSWLVTQRYPQTMIGGGLGMLVIYFLTGNATALVFSIVSVVIGLVYKYAVG